jgi:nitroreductase
MNTIENLKWRYATKKMDATKAVADQDIDTIKEAIRLSASSYGLQPYTVLDITDKDLRAKLLPATWGQTQTTEASHFFVFCNHKTVSDKDVDALMALKSEATGATSEQLSGYADFIKAKLKGLSSDAMENWTARQAYIALGSALETCAELRIDSTPMEGFEPDQYDEILGLSDQGLNACVLLAIGYRHEDDSTQEAPKVRKSTDQLVNIR